MKSLFRVLVAILLLPQFAMAGQAENLKALLDEYHYRISVEWDQQDQVVLSAIKSDFATQFKTLEAQGLTSQDVSILTGVDAEELALEWRLMGDLSPEGLQSFLEEQLQRHQGASWTGGMWVAPVAVIGGFVLLMTILIVSANKKFDRCVEANGGNEDACIER